MELKTARLTLLIDPNKKMAFERLCLQQDRTASQVVRQLIRDYLAHHGVVYQASGADDDLAGPVEDATVPATELRGKRGSRNGAPQPGGAQPGTRRRKG